MTEISSAGRILAVTIDSAIPRPLMDWVVCLGAIGLCVGVVALMFRLADNFGDDDRNKPA